MGNYQGQSFERQLQLCQSHQGLRQKHQQTPAAMRTIAFAACCPAHLHAVAATISHRTSCFSSDAGVVVVYRVRFNCIGSTKWAHPVPPSLQYVAAPILHHYGLVSGVQEVNWDSPLSRVDNSMYHSNSTPL